QETSNQVAKSQEARHPPRSFPEMSRLLGGSAGNRARTEPTRLSALRLSFCAIGQGANRESARSRHFCRSECRSEVRGYFALSRNGQLQRSPQKISGKYRTLRCRDQRVWNS